MKEMSKFRIYVGAVNRSEYVAGFQNTGRGWWNKCETVKTMRCSPDGIYATNIVVMENTIYR